MSKIHAIYYNRFELLDSNTFLIKEKAFSIDNIQGIRMEKDTDNIAILFFALISIGFGIGGFYGLSSSSNIWFVLGIISSGIALMLGSNVFEDITNPQYKLTLNMKNSDTVIIIGLENYQLAEKLRNQILFVKEVLNKI